MNINVNKIKIFVTIALEDVEKVRNAVCENGVGIVGEYCDFIYLFENTKEEICLSFGEEISHIHGNIDFEKGRQEIFARFCIMSLANLNEVSGKKVYDY